MSNVKKFDWSDYNDAPLQAEDSDVSIVPNNPEEARQGERVHVNPFAGAYVNLKDFETEPQETRFVFEGFAMRGKASILAARGGTGKSFFIQQMAFGLAIGRSLTGEFARPATKGKSLVVLGEEDVQDVKIRNYGLGKLLSPAEQKEVAQSVRVLGMAGKDLALAVVAPDGTVMKTRAYDDLVEAARSIPDLAAIFLDPLCLLHGLRVEDSMSGHATHFCRILTELALETNAAVVVTHHVVKVSSGGNGKNKDFSLEAATGADLVRGSSGIIAGFRACAIISELPVDYVAKAYGIKDARPGEYVVCRVAKANIRTDTSFRIFRRNLDYGYLEPGNLELKEQAKKPKENDPAILEKLRNKVLRYYADNQDKTFTERTLRDSFRATYVDTKKPALATISLVISEALDDGVLDIEPGVSKNNQPCEILIPGPEFDTWQGGKGELDFNG